jgi:multidrug efflux pump subunit AcrB
MRWLTKRYEKALHWSCGTRGLSCWLRWAILAASVGCLLSAGHQLPPEMDEGAFVGDYRMPEGTSLEETNRVLMKVEKILKEMPEVESYSRRTGARLALATAEPNFGDFLVKLKRDRSKSAEEVIESFRRRIAETVPVLQIEFAHILEDLIADLVASPQPIEIKVYHPNDATYKAVAGKSPTGCPRSPVWSMWSIERSSSARRTTSGSNPEKAALAGFGVQDVLDLEGRDSGRAGLLQHDPGDRMIGIRVRYPRLPLSSDKLRQLLLTSPTGQTVPLQHRRPRNRRSDARDPPR